MEVYLRSALRSYSANSHLSISMVVELAWVAQGQQSGTFSTTLCQEASSMVLEATLHLLLLVTAATEATSCYQKYSCSL